MTSDSHTNELAPLLNFFLLRGQQEYLGFLYLLFFGFHYSVKVLLNTPDLINRGRGLAHVVDPRILGHSQVRFEF